MNFYSWLFAPRGVVSRRPRLPRGVACDADADKQPKNETLAEHKLHCKAKPDNCPFEKKAVKEAEREDSIFAPLGSPSPVVKEQPNEETPEQREARERDEVVKRYENPNGSKKLGWLKAPNGKPSNLSEQDWIFTRTPSFANRYGDWLSLICKERLAKTEAAKVKIGAFKKLEGQKIQKLAENLMLTPRTYDTEMGRITIDKRSAHSSVSHHYSDKKLDALVSLQDDFERAIYLCSVRDYENPDLTNHFFAYPIEYDGDRDIVCCRVSEDINKNRLYVHEVFVEENLKDMGNALQTAAASSSKDASHTNALPEAKPRGIALMRNILKNIYAVNPDTVSKVRDENNEPLVVYRGGHNIGDDYWENAYFTENKSFAKRFGAVRRFFLDFKKPYEVYAGGGPWDGIATDKFEDGEVERLGFRTESPYDDDDEGGSIERVHLDSIVSSIIYDHSDEYDSVVVHDCEDEDMISNQYVTCKEHQVIPIKETV